MRKNILIISVYFPPLPWIGSRRLGSFAKYLNKEKYNVYVITLKDDDSYLDYELMYDHVHVYRVKNNSLFKLQKFHNDNKTIHYLKVLNNKLLNLFSLQKYKKWTENSYKLAKKIIDEKKIELILSSHFPDDTHIVAKKLKENCPSLKWIADMRDELSSHPFIGGRRKFVYQKLEKEILKLCDAVTTVSKPLLEDFKKNSIKKDLIFCEIRNGYDFDINLDGNIKNDVFTIIYTGTFYGDIQPNNFLIALINLKKKGQMKEFKVIFAGKRKPINIHDEIKDNIILLGELEHEEALSLMHKSDALLLIHPTNGRKGVYTGKLFEYLASLKPIIALVDEEDVAAELIRNANAGYISDNSNIEKIEIILQEAYKEWQENRKREFNIDVIKKHHRKEQTKRLEKLIDEVCSER